MENSWNNIYYFCRQDFKCDWLFVYSVCITIAIICKIKMKIPESNL